MTPATPAYAQEPEDLYARMLDAHLHLLDRQVLDVRKTPVTAVDDIEFAGWEFGPIAPDAEPPEVTALLSGPVLATRIFGGRPPAARLHRIAWSDVMEIAIVITLAVKGSSLDVTWPERWVRDHVIGRIPGGRHDPD